MKKVLIQGSTTPDSDLSTISAICAGIARQAAQRQVCLILSGPSEFDLLIAGELDRCCGEHACSIDDKLLWCLPAGAASTDERLRFGRRLQLDDTMAYGSFTRLRTCLVDMADAVVTFGGAKGVLDVVEKARLVNKPFFPIAVCGGESKQQWLLHRAGDLTFCPRECFASLGDYNLGPDRLVAGIFDALERYWQPPPPRVFIIHGHDGSLKYQLKDFVQNRLNLGEPIILRDQPSRGKTIIEKLEQFAEQTNVVFCLLTPDDEVAGGGDSDAVKWRARQNALFELGFFLGRLGRTSGRIVVLHQGALELPSDISGMSFISVDGGIEAAGEEIRRELAELDLRG